MARPRRRRSSNARRPRASTARCRTRPSPGSARGIEVALGLQHRRDQRRRDLRLGAAVSGVLDHRSIGRGNGGVGPQLSAAEAGGEGHDPSAVVSIVSIAREEHRTDAARADGESAGHDRQPPCPASGGRTTGRRRDRRVDGLDAVQQSHRGVRDPRLVCRREAVAEDRPPGVGNHIAQAELFLTACVSAGGGAPVPRAAAHERVVTTAEHLVGEDAEGPDVSGSGAPRPRRC